MIYIYIYIHLYIVYHVVHLNILLGQEAVVSDMRLVAEVLEVGIHLIANSILELGTCI